MLFSIFVFLKKYEEMIREVNVRMSVTDLNGKHIIRDCYNAFIDYEASRTYFPDKMREWLNKRMDNSDNEKEVRPE